MTRRDAVPILCAQGPVKDLAAEIAAGVATQRQDPVDLIGARGAAPEPSQSPSARILP